MILFVSQVAIFIFVYILSHKFHNYQGCISYFGCPWHSSGFLLKNMQTRREHWGRLFDNFVVIPSLSLCTFSRKRLSPKANNLLVTSARLREFFDLIVAVGTGGNKRREKWFGCSEAAETNIYIITAMWLTRIWNAAEIKICFCFRLLLSNGYN